MSNLTVQVQENDSDLWIPMSFGADFTDDNVVSVARQYVTDIIRSETYVVRARVLKPGRYVRDGLQYVTEVATFERSDFTRDEEAIARVARLAAKYAELD